MHTSGGCWHCSIETVWCRYNNFRHVTLSGTLFVETRRKSNCNTSNVNIRGCMALNSALGSAHGRCHFLSSLVALFACAEWVVDPRLLRAFDQLQVAAPISLRNDRASLADWPTPISRYLLLTARRPAGRFQSAVIERLCLSTLSFLHGMFSSLRVTSSRCEITCGARQSVRPHAIDQKALTRGRTDHFSNMPTVNFRLDLTYLRFPA